MNREPAEASLCQTELQVRGGTRFDWRALIDVIARGQVRRRHDGVDAHGCSGLLPRDRAVWNLIPCTSVALTLLHLAAVVNETTLARAVEQAEICRLFDLRAIDDVLERFAGHRGAKRLRAAVRRIGGGSRTSRNAFEDRLLAAAGIQVIRFIWEDLDRPAQVVAEIEAVAAQRGRERMKSIASATSSVSASRSS